MFWSWLIGFACGAVTVAGIAIALRPQETHTAVLDENLDPVVPGSGQIGRIARFGHIPLGYYDNPEKTATTFLLCAATCFTASRSLSGTRTKPCTSGSKPACTLRLPVADKVAMVRP